MDIQQFKRKVYRKKRVLSAFLKKLDEKVPVGLSKVVAEEDAQVWKETDCTECANCCKTMTPTFSKTDIKRISGHFDLSPKQFFDRYLQKDEDSGDIVNRFQPCPFLVENKCSIYALRPKDCADFPHHFKRSFDLYNDTYLQNLGSCPATFRLIERLEKRIHRDYDF
jgi:Fe-S-cluster containining protein